ncbi:MAG: polysaccharide deacetylase family protein [Candidatus Omnitrophota bacterium]
MNCLFGGDQLRVIYYHRVVEDGVPTDIREPGMFVTRAAFDAQIRHLKDRYCAVSEDQVVAAVNGKSKLPEKAVWVTFDDGYKDNFTLGYPVLKKYGVPATFFVTTGYLNGQFFPADFKAARDLFMTWDDVCSLSRDGFAIGAHTVSHPSARQLSEAELEREVADSKKEIEQRVGITVRSFAYPFGKQINVDAVIGTPVLKRNGLELAVTTSGGVNKDIVAGRYEVKRFGASSRDNMLKFWIKVAFSGAWQT